MVLLVCSGGPLNFGLPSSVGSLGPSCPPAQAVVPSDFFNLFHMDSALTDERAHISPHYDAELRALLVDVIGQPSDKTVVYVQTRGPRFETAAEVRFLVTLGHVVGMTGAHEVIETEEQSVVMIFTLFVGNVLPGTWPAICKCL
jgi:purine nucleoside phosphorylase